MRRFARLVNGLLLSELFLQGRLFTWSSEQEHPTLERIDRAFATSDWPDGFPNHRMRALSADCSDHAPLLLQTTTILWATKRFRFETFWTNFDSFLQVEADAWVCPLQDADAFRVLDYKLRNTAKALKSWSMKNIGSVKLQLILARQIVGRLEAAQDHRTLSREEAALRKRQK
jgi:hypothetical protein